MKYNKSNIMIEAHRIRVQYSLSMSEALTMSWADAKTGVSYESWKENKIDALRARNAGSVYKLEYDVSPRKYLETRRAVQVQEECNINIEDLNFAVM